MAMQSLRQQQKKCHMFCVSQNKLLNKQFSYSLFEAELSW